MANEIASDLGVPKISQEQYEMARNSHPRDALKTFGIPIRAVPRLRKASHEKFRERMNDIKIIPGMREVIVKLSRNHTLGILTSNDAKLVEGVLKRLKLDSEFDFINSAVSIFGKHRALKKIIARKGFEKEDTLYVGDEVRDIEGAQKAGLSSIAVTWGFNTKEILATHQPDQLIAKPQQLLKIV